MSTEILWKKRCCRTLFAPAVAAAAAIAAAVVAAAAARNRLTAWLPKALLL